MPENLAGGSGLASPRLYHAYVGKPTFSKQQPDSAVSAPPCATTSHISGMPKPIPQRASAFSGYISSSSTSTTVCEGSSSLDSEAWHAAAGPLVCLPRVGDRVVYFPQGHIEQVLASTNQNVADLQIPQYNLPSQIFCRVLNLSLGAYRETDEVYAQMTLVPENEQIDQSVEFDEPTVSAKPKLSMFCKNLTSSDTSTHGGFSVPRRAAEECFPQLDYQQTPPAQELIAKDLHGIEWKFRHIYRGQPRRHLLTTGWSVFVSQKKLVAGDAVLFVRGDNGELRIGIRRAVRSQSSVTSSSLLSSHSMQIGVLAAAAHAVATKTMFTIFYNPRASPAEFVVPYHKYLKSFKLNISVGMRFKMRFETEDSSERRYMGTITGIGDIDPARWPGSKWRFLKVGWDEHAASERQERVSPWEIEPFIAPNVSPPAMSTKRFRPTMLTDIGVRGSYDIPSPGAHLQQALQNSHDLQTPHRQCGAEGRDFLLKSSPWSSPKAEISKKNKAPGRTVPAENLRACLRPGLRRPNSMNTSQQEDYSRQKLDMHQQQLRLCVQQFREQKSGDALSSGYGVQPGLDYPTLSAYMKPQAAESSFLKLLLSPRPPLDQTSNVPAGRAVELDELKSVKAASRPDDLTKPSECKLFGFSLKSKSSVSACKQVGLASPTASAGPSCYPLETQALPGFAQLRCFTSQNWNHPPQSRTCTKVHKQGAVGRAVDVSKFEGYSDLLTEIRQLFGIDEALNDSDIGWQAVYIDHEGDMLLIGDDTWEDFCNSVRSIRILSPAEVQKMTHSRTIPLTEEPSSRDVSRLSDQQDSSSSPPTATTGDELDKV